MGLSLIERCFVSSRDPRKHPAAGDMLRTPMDDRGRVAVCEVMSVGRYGVRFKKNGQLQSACDVQAWQQWAKDAEVIHEGE